MIMVGDIHRLVDVMLEKIEIYDIRDANFIQVGDLGLGFERVADDLNMLSSVDEFMQKRNSIFYAIRGNHDNKWFWDHYQTLRLKNVILVSDYETLYIEGKRVLFIGGGISVDRAKLIPGKSYFEDEGFIYDESRLRAICNNQDIDIMVTHIAPAGAWPNVLHDFIYKEKEEELPADATPEQILEMQTRIEKDKKLAAILKAELLVEREDMGKVLEIVKNAGCRQWYYGHYHKNVAEYRDGIYFRCLETHEFFVAKN